MSIRCRARLVLLSVPLLCLGCEALTGGTVEPDAVLVAVQMEDGVARVGRVELAAGSSFQLQAVAVRETEEGVSSYYSRARQIEVDGEVHEALPVEELGLDASARFLWFTVEGTIPFIDLAETGTEDWLRYEEYYRPELGRSWTATGTLESQFDDQLENEGLGFRRDFGVQRFQVWLELFDTDNPLVARKRLSSSGAQEALAGNASVATVTALLPGKIAPASSAFGLPQVALPPGDDSLLPEVSQRWQQRLAFARLNVLRSLLDDAEVELSALDWQRLDLLEGRAWGDMTVGDLVRVGSRFVVLFRDEGTVGIVDGEDLCFDFEDGASIRRLDQVFVGAGDVFWAALPEPGRAP